MMANAPLSSVALLAEGVDRNLTKLLADKLTDLSPSSRRAWIEIDVKVVTRDIVKVALLAEGVDRNGFHLPIRSSPARRPPRGGRG